MSGNPAANLHFALWIERSRTPLSKEKWCSSSTLRDCYKSLLLSNFLSCNYWKSRFILELTTCACVHLILQVIHNHGSYTFLLSCTISSFVGFCLFLLFLYVQHFYRNYTDGEYTADIHTWDVMWCHVAAGGNKCDFIWLGNKMMPPKVMQKATGTTAESILNDGVRTPFPSVYSRDTSYRLVGRAWKLRQPYRM